MIRIVRTREALRDALATVPRPIGLVPTMGWLHEGHRSLIARSHGENATTVVSIFVNPRQFGDPTDLERYPRNEARDVETCEAAGADLVFAPTVEAMYPPGYDTTVSVDGVAHRLEGASRPGHFDGVATVVALLFGLVEADVAYFGQKDAQQVLVIARMATDLGYRTRVVPCPTVREADGLAMSSRNVHLSPAERSAAPALYRALRAAEAAWRAGEQSGEALRARMREVLAAEPLAVVDYVSCASATTLEELVRVDGAALLSLAVRFGSTRLIDNLPLD